ncbi:HypC/HybG/HupF family hydrogenase formation chaperone [Thiohalocapsa sp. ML1]|jgi:hydrogenase expression/formation protein HypC|uniref:HypC/HybG/HupF family hydrogenase formation chaperone n=1 Tax=Thiohalocapsa sp. ML1 TaxID=1431688 RepID=UPI0007320C0B|nr:HypC/HybG/HupF family hydrogenase formation chaperone [Thiohalocapsa sp. ML1]
MCIGIPMQIIAINGMVARCEAKGAERDATLLLLGPDEVAVGDYVVVHLGHAIERIDAARAAEAWALYDEMLSAGQGG